MLLHHGAQGSPAKVFQYEIIDTPFLTLVQVPLDEWVAEALADLRFASVARKDRSSSNQVIRWELEDNLLQSLAVLGQVDLARPSPPQQAGDVGVGNAPSWLVAC